MSTMQTSLPIDTEELKRILVRYGVKEASLFGSFARGEATDVSDSTY